MARIASVALVTDGSALGSATTHPSVNTSKTTTVGWFKERFYDFIGLSR